MQLPIDSIRADFDAALETESARVVLAAPTGSGKSTRVPVWCGATRPVLVVEPRRVACRALAQRVASLEGVRLGGRVGYRVRDDDRSGPDTRILFATPGVLLRMLAGDPDRLRDHTVVVDEFHERGLETDLILALLVERPPARLVVMSATIELERIAERIGGSTLQAEGRLFPVERRYVAGDVLLPTVEGLERRLKRALERSRDDPGDVLVFLPGKAEIRSAAAALGGLDVDVRELHGGLTLDAQMRAFEQTRRRKVILSTNVAETSLTVPGVGVVVDAGLVRRTRYHDGRGFLALAPIAWDSAEQRAGRAGRTAPGVCYRLWSEAARLSDVTPPEIHRESLTPLLMAAAACGADPAHLPFVDPPKPHALDAARADLDALGALDPAGGLSERGRVLFGLPIDAPHGQLLVQAEAEGPSVLDDAIDLVGALAVGRPLFVGPRPKAPEDDLRAQGCDVVGAIRAVREGVPGTHGLSGFVLDEARRIARRLRKMFGRPPGDRRETGAPIDRRALADCALRADPRCAYVVRRRKKRVAFSNGGTEIELGRASAVDADAEGTRPGEPALEALLVFGTHALGVGARDTRILITCGMPVPLAWLGAAGIGRERPDRVELKGGVVRSTIERVWAGKVIATREAIPEGAVARAAIAALYERGSLFREVRAESEERLAAAHLLRRLRASGVTDLDPGPWVDPPPDLRAWAEATLETLGVETGHDVGLLSADDLRAPDLPYAARAWLDAEFPRQLDLGDTRYALEWDLAKRTVTMAVVEGKAGRLPTPQYLPRLRGFRVQVRVKSRVQIVRDR